VAISTNSVVSLYFARTCGFGISLENLENFEKVVL